MSTSKDRLKNATKVASQVDAFLPSELTPEQKPDPKQKKKYLNVDVTGKQDYLALMSRRSGLSQTGYINRLIDADMRKNQAVFEKLKAAQEELEKI